MARHLVTGATGFVGAALVLELLAETPDEVACLVRAGDAAGAQARLLDGLTAAAEAYGRPDLGDEARRRCAAVPGDVTAAPDGALAAAFGRCTDAWHSAASLRYLHRDAEEIIATNVGGTRHALDLAARTGAERFNTISTAYVAGKRTGLVLEEPVTPEDEPHNEYERSKQEAERLVLSDDRMLTRVLRPSIVIGHSRTLATFSSTGLYGAFVQFAVFRDRVAKKLGAYLSHYRAQICADPDTELNAIPIDLVAANAVRIGRSDSPHRVFNLTNGAAPTVADGAAAAFQVLGMMEPELVPGRATFSSLDRGLDRGIDFFAPYMKSSKTFDRAHTDAVCGPDASTFPLSRELLVRFGVWFQERRAVPAGSAS